MQERSTCKSSLPFPFGVERTAADNRFGGTDGNFHYNDTWCLDIATGEWQELSCIGYIPVPREGHAAAMVDDVIYVFGGRDVNGKDLGDLAAFRTTSKCPFSFHCFHCFRSTHLVRALC